MENTSDRLTDYFSTEDIQSLQNALARTIRLPIVVVDAEGRPITRQRNTGFFCRLKTKGAACPGCWSWLPHPRTGGPLYGACPRTGLSLAGIPIDLDGTCLGGWVLGQLRLTKPAGKTLKNVARTNALSLEDAKSGMDAIPPVGWQELEQVVNFLDSVRRMLPWMIRADCVGPCCLEELGALLPPPPQNK